jgi:hypothetical protein
MKAAWPPFHPVLMDTRQVFSWSLPIVPLLAIVCGLPFIRTSPAFPETASGESSSHFAVQVWRPPIFGFGPTPPPQRRLISAARRLQRMRSDAEALGTDNRGGHSSRTGGWWWLDPAAVVEIARQLDENDHAVLDGFLGGDWAARLLLEARGLISTEGIVAGRVGGGEGSAASALRSDTIVWAPRDTSTATSASSTTEPSKQPALDHLVAGTDALVGSLRNMSLQTVVFDADGEAGWERDREGREASAAASIRTAEALSDTTWHSEPMLSLYRKGGHRYVRHMDNICERGRGRQCNGRRLTLIFYLTDHHGRRSTAERQREKQQQRRTSGSSAPEVWAVGTTSEVDTPDEAFTAGALRLFGADAPDSDPRVDIEPRTDRLVAFWADLRVPHAVLPTDEEHDRYAVTLWYFDTHELARARARTRATEASTNTR